MQGLERSNLGGCRLIRRIGAGAMGEVYLAEQVHLGNRLVAVKVVQVLHDPSLPDDSIEGAERHFIHEAELLGQLTHPHILPVYHSGIEAGYLFLVMQYAPDGSLADAINARGPHQLELPASLPFVVDVISQVAGALQYTHDHGVIHADVKPANVLAQVEPNGHWHVLLADFGIAHSRDTVASRNEIAGTVAYMAPEQFYGKVSPASDQYALAVMAFQLLTGRTPFVGGFLEVAQAHAHGNPPALRSLNSFVPAAVEPVIARALAKQPADRYPSVSAFAEALRTAFMGASTIFDGNTREAAEVLPVAGGPFVGPHRPMLMAHAPLAAAYHEPASGEMPDTLPPTVRVARYDAASTPDTTRPQRNTRGIATRLAVVALLLFAVVAAIGLRSHIGVSQASSSSLTGVGASSGKTPVSSLNRGNSSGNSGTGGGASEGSSSPPTVVVTPATPTPQVTPSPEATQTPTPTSTATATPEPKATATPAPSATATPTKPKATPTPAPGPKATATPAVVPPTAAATPPPPTTATAASAAVPPLSSSTAPTAPAPRVATSPAA